MAEEFVALLKNKDWDEAIKEFNGKLKDKEISVLPLSRYNQRENTRSSLLSQKGLEIRSSGLNNSMVEYMNKSLATNRLLQDKLYDLIPVNETEAKNIRAIVESATDGACLVVKDVSRSQVTTEAYEKNKIVAAYSLDTTRSDNLALIHFSPDNIIERMGFEWTKKNSESKVEVEVEEETDADETNKDGEV